MRKTLAALLSGLSLSAMAGSYVDANIGIDTGNNNLALGANYGYMFNKYIGAEGGISGSENYFLYDAAAKGVLPLGPVDIYGKLGVGINNYSGLFNNSSVGLLYGGGVAYNISKSWQIHIEDYTVSGANPNFLLFGGEFKF